MPHPHHSASFRTIALLSMVTMLLSACTSWQPISLQTGPIPQKVRVTTESDRFVLNATRLVGDTAISGLARTTRGDVSRRSILLADASLVEQSHFSLGRTLGLIALIPYATFGFFGALYWVTGTDPCC